MIDLIMALWGKKHCGWCVEKENWFDRRFGSKYYGEAPLWERAVWWLYSTPGEKLGIWKLGQWWHFQIHLPLINWQGYLTECDNYCTICLTEKH